MNTLIWSYVPYSDNFHFDWEQQQQQHYGDHDDPAVMTVVGLFRVKFKKKLVLDLYVVAHQVNNRIVQIWLFSSRSSLSPHLCPFGCSHQDHHSLHIFAHLAFLITIVSLTTSLPIFSIPFSQESLELGLDKDSRSSFDLHSGFIIRMDSGFVIISLVISLLEISFVREE